MKTQWTVRTALVAILIVSLLAAGSDGTAASTTTFSGRATAVRGTIAGIAVGPLADTGEVNPAGDSLEATLLEYPIAGVPDPTSGALSGEVLHAAVVAHGDRSSAEASVASFTLSAAGQTVRAEFLMARASATCQAGTATVSGNAEIAGLTLNNQSITVSGRANQIVPLVGLGQIVINEQITDSSLTADRGGLTVNALHVVVNGLADVVVASAHADIVCGAATACASHDFVTGGGWITTPAGSRANFAVAGGVKNGAFWGHLTYIDHGTPGLKVKGTGVTAYVPTGTTSRHIEGGAVIAGGAGTYTADVADNGEPGHDLDTFALTLPTGYAAGGRLGGGNIQLHCN